MRGLLKNGQCRCILSKGLTQFALLEVSRLKDFYYRVRSAREMRDPAHARFRFNSILTPHLENMAC